MTAITMPAMIITCATKLWITSNGYDRPSDLTFAFAASTIFFHSGNLLKHLGIHKPLYSLPAFDEAARVEPLVRRLVEGQSLALVTDAGTPAISDPGAILVRRALEEGVQVVPVPGASAAVAAVSVSGFPEGRYHFAGFLPRKTSHREEMLAELRGLRAQLVFYESPQRLARTLAIRLSPHLRCSTVRSRSIAMAVSTGR